MARDPVCGVEVKEGGEGVVGPDGRTWMFCCASCRWAFEQDPEKFSRP